MIDKETLKEAYDNDIEILKKAYESDEELAKTVQKIIDYHIRTIWTTLIGEGVVSAEKAAEYIIQVNNELERR